MARWICSGTCRNRVAYRILRGCLPVIWIHVESIIELVGIPTLGHHRVEPSQYIEPWNIGVSGVEGKLADMTTHISKDQPMNYRAITLARMQIQARMLRLCQ